MSDDERQYFVNLNRRLRRISARAEALACGYVTADMEKIGDENAARIALLTDIHALAVDLGFDGARRS